jgi:hypothetical protein
MRLCSTGTDQFVANATRERQIGKGPMQVPQFAAAEPEFNAAEAMVVRRHPLSTRHGLTHRFDCREFRHHFFS